MHPMICAALSQVTYSCGREFGEWSLFNLADLIHYRTLQVEVEPQFCNQPEPDGYVEWEPEASWRVAQPILDALLTNYDAGLFTVDDVAHTVVVLTRYSLRQRDLGVDY